MQYALHMKHTTTVSTLKVGNRIRWSESIGTRMNSSDTNPRSGEGIVKAVYYRTDGRLEGFVVSYHPEGSAEGFIHSAYYSTPHTEFKILDCIA